MVVAAGGLGTRVQCWARFIPKEFYPVDGRPGLVHLLEEIAALGPAEAVVVYHPYYERFAAWARQVLSEHGQARYTHLTGHSSGAALPAGVRVSFIPQHGPYADLTSVVNGADHLGTPARLYVAFADNLYCGPNPLLALGDPPACQVAVLASRYQPELTASHGVITTTGRPGQRLMTSLAEKPGPALARALERRSGRGNLFLLEGRVRLTAAFTEFAVPSRCGLRRLPSGPRHRDPRGRHRPRHPCRPSTGRGCLPADRRRCLGRPMTSTGGARDSSG